MDEPKPGPASAAGVGLLAEHLISKKGLAKAREDITKIKGIVSEMQVNVIKHGVEIETNMVTEESLKVALELINNEFGLLLDRRLTVAVEALKPKIKKRVKLSEYKDYIKSKVSGEEFQKQIERLDSQIQIMEDKLDFRLPALEYNFTRDLKKKADKDEV